jgi:hypothetical protein
MDLSRGLGDVYKRQQYYQQNLVKTKMKDYFMRLK